MGKPPPCRSGEVRGSAAALVLLDPAHAPLDELGGVDEVELFLDVGAVGLDRLDGNAEAFGDLAGGEVAAGTGVEGRAYCVSGRSAVPERYSWGYPMRPGKTPVFNAARCYQADRLVHRYAGSRDSNSAAVARIAPFMDSREPMPAPEITSSSGAA